MRAPELAGQRLERGGDVARGVPGGGEALGDQRRRGDLHGEAGDVVARVAAGERDRGRLEVLDDRARAVGRPLDDERGQLLLAQQPPGRGGLADAVGVEGEQVAGAELELDLGQLGLLDDPERRADLADADAAPPLAASTGCGCPAVASSTRAPPSVSSTRASATVTKPGARWRSSASLRRASM